VGIAADVIEVEMGTDEKVDALGVVVKCAKTRRVFFTREELRHGQAGDRTRHGVDGLPAFVAGRERRQGRLTRQRLAETAGPDSSSRVRDFDRDEQRLVRGKSRREFEPVLGHWPGDLRRRYSERERESVALVCFDFAYGYPGRVCRAFAEIAYQDAEALAFCLALSRDIPIG